MILGSLSFPFSYSKYNKIIEPPLTATSLRQPFFLADSPYINFCFNLSTPVTSLQWPPSSVPKVTVIAGHLILRDGAISQN